jgi:hypothetical protein
MRLKRFSLRDAPIALAVVLSGMLVLAGCPPGQIGPPYPIIQGGVSFDDAPMSGVLIEVSDTYLSPTVSIERTTGSDGAYSFDLTSFVDAGIANATIWFHGPAGYVTEGYPVSNITSMTDETRDYDIARVIEISDPADSSTDVSTTATVTWDAAAEAAEYELQFWHQTDPSTWTYQESVDHIVGTSYTVTAGVMLPDEGYMLDVLGFNANGTRVADANPSRITTAP